MGFFSKYMVRDDLSEVVRFRQGRIDKKPAAVGRSEGGQARPGCNESSCKGPEAGVAWHGLGGGRRV